MPSARYRGEEYELLNFTEDAEWVLRDAGNNVMAVESEEVVPICEVCGRASSAVAPAPTRDGQWVCHDRACADG